MKKTNKSLAVGLVCLLLIFLISPREVLANNEFDKNKDVLFTIDLKHRDMPLANTKFDLYKVADIDNQAGIELNDKFKEYPIEFIDLDQEGWNKYALTLKGYVQKEALKPTISATTNSLGVLETKVKAGLYLVVGNDTIRNGFKYKVNPYLVILPGFEKETGIWDYEISSYPKTTEEEVKIEKIDKKLLKLWDDSGYEKERPEKIELELLANGKTFKSITLSKKNNWSHVCKQLDPDVNWTVIEKNMKGSNYSVEIREEGDSFIVENKYRAAKDPSKPKEPLPQTGQEWKLIYGLLGLGILLILLGLVKNMMDNKK